MTDFVNHVEQTNCLTVALMNEHACVYVCVHMCVCVLCPVDVCHS